MATWVILIGVVVTVAILGGALVLVFVFTRDRAESTGEVPGFKRFRAGDPVDVGPPTASPQE